MASKKEDKQALVGEKEKQRPEKHGYQRLKEESSSNTDTPYWGATWDIPGACKSTAPSEKKAKK